MRADRALSGRLVCDADRAKTDVYDDGTYRRRGWQISGFQADRQSGRNPAQRTGARAPYACADPDILARLHVIGLPP